MTISGCNTLLQLLQALSPGCPESKQKSVLSIGWTSLVVSHSGWLLLWIPLCDSAWLISCGFPALVAERLSIQEQGL